MPHTGTLPITLPTHGNTSSCLACDVYVRHVYGVYRPHACFITCTIGPQLPRLSLVQQQQLGEARRSSVFDVFGPDAAAGSISPTGWAPDNHVLAEEGPDDGGFSRRDSMPQKVR